MHLYNDIIKKTFLQFLEGLNSGDNSSKEKFVLYTELLIDRPSETVNEIIRETLISMMNKGDISSFKNNLKQNIQMGVEIAEINENLNLDNKEQRFEKIYNYYLILMNDENKRRS